LVCRRADSSTAAFESNKSQRFRIALCFGFQREPSQDELSVAGRHRFQFFHTNAGRRRGFGTKQISAAAATMPGCK